MLDALLGATGGAIRVGISGAPGAGKSTFIEVLGLHLVEAGHRVAVLAVDPSSARSRGSILGDKTRMEELSRRPEAYIRPSPAGGTLGGVARRTREALLCCEAAGFGVVLVETVGVGQSEIAVAGMVDHFVLLLAPGAGDDLQGVKRGIVELADLVVVNKADGSLADAARHTAADYAHALHIVGSAAPVLLASAREGTGVGEVWAAVEGAAREGRESGAIERRRRGQAREWMWSEVTETLVDEARADPLVRGKVAALEDDVASGRCSPASAANRILTAFRARRG